jgi:hypothetical protein
VNTLDKAALRQRLSRLYADMSKHSTYQTVPDFVSDAIDYQVAIDEGWRGDRVRLRWCERVLADERGRRWSDFGANTGFFSLSLAHADPTREILAIEGNPNHAEFIRAIAEGLGVRNLHVLSRAIALDDLDTLPLQDVMLHLNVLHHAGVDFDAGMVVSRDEFLAYAGTYLQRLRCRVGRLVFQVGTNLGGDKARPIIDHADDVGKLLLLARLLHDAGWHIERVAYPTRPLDDSAIEYVDLVESLDLTDRDAIRAALVPFNLRNHRGEFYRRPVFLCSNRLR